MDQLTGFLQPSKENIDYLSNTLRDVLGSKTGKITTEKLLIGASVAMIFIILLFYLLKKFAHILFIQKIKSIAKGIWQGVTSIKYVKKKGLFIFHTIFIWAMYLLSVRLGFLALQETSSYAWKPALSVLTSGSLAMIMPSPGGLGFYPLFVQTTMEIYGLRSTIGFAFGALMWGAQFFQMLLSGFVAFVLLPIINKQKKIYAES